MPKVVKPFIGIPNLARWCQESMPGDVGFTTRPADSVRVAARRKGVPVKIEEGVWVSHKNPKDGMALTRITRQGDPDNG